jgi:nitrogen fixation protein FixH
MRTKGWYWPWIIAALLIGTVAGQGVMLYAAATDPTFVVEPDYYKKAVDFDDVIAQEAANQRLGWRTAAQLGARRDAGAAFAVRITDASGDPVSGARVSVVAINNLDGEHHVSAALAERGSGEYAAALPLDRDGLWEFRIDAVRGADRFTADLHGDAAARPSAATPIAAR